MAYLLFILVCATLFLRPAELAPGLVTLPLYQILIVLCTVASWPMISAQFSSRSLRTRPITVCVLGLAAIIPLSHIQRVSGDALWMARYSFTEFGKVTVIYLIAVGLLRNERRLGQFLRTLLFLIVAMASLSMSHHFGLVYLPSLASLERIEGTEDGDWQPIHQLRGTGVFNDPNDLAMILVVGVVIAGHLLTERKGFRGLLVGLPALGVLSTALFLTRSRGGMLALFAAIAVLAYARWGWRRTLLVSALALPLVVVVFSTRGGAGLEEGTAQGRIQFWAEGIGLLKSSPLLGIGFNRFADEVGYVAHNSFIHSYVELGLIGGTLFFGCFFFSFSALYAQWKSSEIRNDRALHRYTAMTAAMLVGLGVSMMSISRSYVVPTYLVFALCTAVISLNGAEDYAVLPRLTMRQSQRLACCSALFLAAFFMFTRVMVRWS